MEQIQTQVGKLVEKRLRVRTSLTEDEVRLLSDIRRAD
jgi:hypothetical protein